MKHMKRKKMKIDPEKRYTTKEVATLWNLGKHGDYTIRYKIKRGELTAFNLGTTKRPQYRILGSEIIRYEEEHST